MANLPSFTKTFHRDVYPGISPTRPGLSAVGKVVVVTGAGGQIGKATCKAFARAGAKHVAMLDLNGGNLQTAKAEIEQDPECQTSILHLFPVDITDQAAIKETFSTIESAFGNVNVLVNNAGYQPTPQRYRDAAIDEWWRGFEVNVKGSFIVTQEFVQHAALATSKTAAPTLINISSILAHWGIRQGYLNGQSSYSGAKIAMTRAMEILQEEEPWLRVFNVHPGLVATPMAAKSGTLSFSVDNGKYQIMPQRHTEFRPWLMFPPL
jgi:NAD(P)-dependent dehydrogenase (short-subunit alcohol dehydrogenase family)